MNVFQSALTVIISLLGSGVVSAVITHKLSLSEKKRELKRDKLEKLYLAGVHYQAMLLNNFALAVGYHQGKASKEEVNKIYGKDSEKDKEANNMMTMICNIYFPELVPSLQKILAARDMNGNNAIAEAMMGSTPEKKQAERLLLGMKPLFESFDEFNQQLFKVGLKIND